MYIFYDFETSSRELLGQILSYSFIVTNHDFAIIDSCSGYIKPNRLQLPEPEAILVNKLNVETLQKTGQTEYEAAHHIYSFLNRLVSTGTSWTLIGFNSNQFDLQFLRVLLIRYGLNPYFKGQLAHCDILHVAQHIAFTHPSTFPWIKHDTADYYSFKLEDLATAFSLLDGPQRHDATDDVKLTIALTKQLESQFSFSLSTFMPFSIQDTSTINEQTCFKIKQRHFPNQNEPLQHYIYTHYALLASMGKTYICICLDTLNNEDPLTHIKYFNANKHFVHAEPFTNEDKDTFSDSLERISHIPLYQKIKHTPSAYFDLIKKEWDIDYQIHELGFQRIDTLGQLVKAFMKDSSSYDKTLKTLIQRVQEHNDIKDRYLLQLYNRVYLNYHPNPKVNYIHKYTFPRYVTGELLRDWDTFRTLDDTLETITRTLEDPLTSSIDKENMAALLNYYTHTIQHYINQ